MPSLGCEILWDQVGVIAAMIRAAKKPYILTKKWNDHCNDKNNNKDSIECIMPALS